MSSRITNGLILKTAPPLDPAWLAHEGETGLLEPPKQKPMTPLEHQPVYAADCRALNAKMMEPGARDFHLSQGIDVVKFTVPSSLDGFEIPVLRYTRSDDDGDDDSEADGDVVGVYYHGGGLVVGDADSEELSCRRIVKTGPHDGRRPQPRITALYSVGYRLMPAHPATTCVSDAADALRHVRDVLHPSSSSSSHNSSSSSNRSRSKSKVILVGSSSGGELAALVSQQARPGDVDGVLLRGPVTADAFAGLEAYVPEGVRHMHTSATEPSFRNSLLGAIVRDEPRDGLPRMPLEASREELQRLPRHWIQVCTNDALYSDGVCYARLLEDAGVEVRVDVVEGWPHTFWLKAPQLDRALQAEEEMLKGLAWVCGLDF